MIEKMWTYRKAVEDIESGVRKMIIPDKKGSSAWRPDEAAWASLALESHGGDESLVESIRKRLAEGQLENGCVPLLVRRDGQPTMDTLPQRHWPTVLALLAWNNSPEFEESRRKALDYLTKVTCLVLKKEKDSPAAHDFTLRGWSWNAGTFSWVIPTSQAILAFKACGRGSHKRVSEAVKLLIDRQLPSGGWNYGNTKVFKSTLKPLPEDTGYALCALAGSVGKVTVAPSIEYLICLVEKHRTPSSLSWIIMGLDAWELRPKNTEELIAESLKRQDRLGPYGIRYLSQLVVARNTRGGLSGLFTGKGGKDAE